MPRKTKKQKSTAANRQLRTKKRKISLAREVLVSDVVQEIPESDLPDDWIDCTSEDEYESDDDEDSDYVSDNIAEEQDNLTGARIISQFSGP
jgi:hypothetical protein